MAASSRQAALRLRSSQGIALQEAVMPFGKHKGKPIKLVDDGYLRWMQGTIGASAWKEVVSQVLEQRKQQAGGSTKGRNNRVLLDELKLCSRTRNLKRGREIHLEAARDGNDSCIQVATALINMYAKCGSMADAREVFNSAENRDVVLWTAVILGYAENGEGVAALDLFAEMRSQGCAPDSITFIAALKACSSLAVNQPSRRVECLERGRQMHSEIGDLSDIYLQNSLIDMYAKCGSIVEAHQVFNGIKYPTVVSWTSLILGYAEKGDGATALTLFSRMKSQGCEPNSFTFVAALKACSLLGALESGCRIHAEVNAAPTQPNPILINTLVDFYAKCGSMQQAQKVFDSNPRTRTLITWTALLAGYSRLGDSKSVFELFERMQDAGFQPDGITFLSILTCCSHAGLVDKAKEVLESMSSKYGVSPTVEHYTCIVDMLGRSNNLGSAVSLLQSMSCKPDAVVWMTLLGACRKWKNVEIGRLAFTSLVGLDDTVPAVYVLMAHIYGSRGMWEEKDMVLGLRRKFRAWKDPGQSWWTNGVDQVHTFLVQTSSDSPDS